MFRSGNGAARRHVGGNVPEIAGDTIAVGQRYPRDPPFVILGDTAVTALLGPLGLIMWLAGCQGMAKPFDDLVRVALRPQDVNDLSEIAADQIRDIPKDGGGSRVHLADAQRAVHEIHPTGASSKIARNWACVLRSASSACLRSR